MFDLTIVNKVRRHYHSLLVGQYMERATILTFDIS